MKALRFPCIASVSVGIAFCGVSLTANAQQSPATPDGHMNMSAGSSGADSSPSTQAFKESGERMMKGMNIPYTGDADRDVVSHMIAHHQGAVAMAEVELKYGKDPEMRKLASDIIKAQNEEITRMKKWQAKHPVK